MKVVTLHETEFRDTCHRLRDMACGFDANLIVGIATGGVYVAEHICGDVQHVAVTCRRAGTASKRRHEGVFRIIRLMPEWVRNRLRIAESQWLRRKGVPGPREVSMEPEAAEAIRRATRILIVDDAVDSGATLQAVRHAIAEMSPTAAIATAAITVTTAQVVERPDYVLFDDETLIRFPWSMDMPAPKGGGR